MTSLSHRCVYEDNSSIALKLSLGDELGPLGGGATFPLVEDPRNSDRTSIIGMFVLRPARAAWTATLLEQGKPLSMFNASDWCFNVRGVDGGWLIAGGNPLDAYRLALQYGLADAVLVGSNTVSKEGVDHGDQPGYLWQPYGPAAWPHLAAIDPNLPGKIARLRTAWQQQGVLSARKYPAQIVVSQSGEHRPPANDLFAASVFKEKHPDGSPIEVYVLTSAAGAERMRGRAAAYGLAQRIDSILLPLSPPGKPEELDIPNVPTLLRKKLDIRLANHDGGQTVLSKFSEAGVLSQMNLTLMRGRAVFDLLASTDRISAAELADITDAFDAKRQLFWSGNHKLPATLKVMSVLADAGEGVVVSFDARRVRGL